MKTHPRAGLPPDPSTLIDISRLISSYYSERPDPGVPSQRVSFGTSGHRGSAFNNSFNEAHILAITQAICDYRRERGAVGPLFLGKDTHALSGPASVTAIEVLAANGVAVMIDHDGGFTPTPVVSHAILGYNKGRTEGLADGIVVTPSHNPPEDGGFKYNGPDGGPADTDVTGWIEPRSNKLLEDGLRQVLRMPYEKAVRSSTVRRHDYLGAYVDDLDAVVD
ncbi:MAG: alpha-D-glucose phosphate-specific phosphoglucomutase, partial [Terriglobia bacterium]